jgi:ribose 5-phosphate isomerase B
LSTRILIACDHAGFPLKQVLIVYLRSLSYEVKDLGTNSPISVDYPDYAEKLALEVKKGWAPKGILICGSGVGASIAANKVKGIRAAICHDTYSAHQGVEHDDMNILVLGARVIGERLAEELVAAFLNAKFMDKEERFVRRVEKISKIEEKN